MQIEIYQDTACPWCRIGKRHLEMALQGWQGEPVELRYRAFLLNPGLPAEGADFREVMQAKGGGRVPLEAFFNAPRQRGAGVGLAFNFEKITRAPNTELSHRLIAIAPTEKQAALIEAVYAAYFEHGQDIGDLVVLLDIGAACGLDPAQSRAAMEGDGGRAVVAADVRQARLLGIDGVPFFVIDGKYGLSGAQPPEAILAVLVRAAAERNQAN